MGSHPTSEERRHHLALKGNLWLLSEKNVGARAEMGSSGDHGLQQCLERQGGNSGVAADCLITIASSGLSTELDTARVLNKYLMNGCVKK